MANTASALGFAHRLNTSVPLAIVGGYGNGGGREHTAYVGLGGECWKREGAGHGGDRSGRRRGAFGAGDVRT